MFLVMELILKLVVFSKSKFAWYGPFQRFKEMREMHGSSSRDDRQKREQQRQEREMAKFAQMYPLCVSFG